jgi:ribonuclease VapC
VIVDSSALVAILFDEADAVSYAHTLAVADVIRISAATLLETAIVIEGQAGPTSGHRLDLMLARLDVVTESVTADQIAIARQAWRDFGRGSGHSAQLNFGDCFSYALARVTGEPLLCKGHDLAATGIPLAQLIHP